MNACTDEVIVDQRLTQNKWIREALINKKQQPQKVIKHKNKHLRENYSQILPWTNKIDHNDTNVNNLKQKKTQNRKIVIIFMKKNIIVKIPEHCVKYFIKFQGTVYHLILHYLYV